MSFASIIKRKPSLLLLTAFVISCLGLTGCQSARDNDDVEETHDTHWSYAGETGPEHWAELNPNYEIMATGERQSPIDIEPNTVITMASNASHDYDESSLSVMNNGHTIQVNVYDENTISISGKDYELLQFHFHSPSEHTIDGEHFPLEAHFVHMSSDGELAVIGVLFSEVSTDNETLAPIWAVMPETEDDPSVFLESDMNPMSLFPSGSDFYTYSGSLTTPPGTEGVHWIVMKTPQTISSDQVDAFVNINGENSRPTQPLHNRDISQDSF